MNQLGWTEPDSKVNKEPINKSLIEHHHHRSQPEERSPLSSDSSSLRSWHLNRRCLASRFGWNPPLLGSLPANFLRFDNCVPAGSSAIPIPGQASTSVVDGELSATATSTSPLSSALLQQKMQENERQRLQLASSLDDAEAAQYLEDERIAIFLQNEEFVSELRRNKEFMSALHYDAMRGRNSTSTATSSSSTSANGFCNENYTGDLAGNSQYEHTSHESDADFKEKLKNMGKASRRKFAQVSTLFS